jgi:hypothetical protein
MDIETGHYNGHKGTHIVPSASTGSLNGMAYTSKSLSKAFLSAGMVVSIKVRNECRRLVPCASVVRWRAFPPPPRPPALLCRCHA